MGRVCVCACAWVCVYRCVSVASAIVKSTVLPLHVEGGWCQIGCSSSSTNNLTVNFLQVHRFDYLIPAWCTDTLTVISLLGVQA